MKNHRQRMGKLYSRHDGNWKQRTRGERKRWFWRVMRECGEDMARDFKDIWRTEPSDLSV
jgi:hypothetical protein